MIRKMLLSTTLACLAGVLVLASPIQAATGPKAVLAHYADMAHAKFGDVLSVAHRLDKAAIERLVDQTRTIERIIASLKIGKIKLEGSDSLDNPGAVVQ